MKDKITASMATIPGREEALRETVASLIGQVDVLFIYANNYRYVPEFLNHAKIRVFLSSDYLGDLGDSGKFFNSHTIKGYHFTVDDDIIYPEDYVSKSIEAIEKHKRKFVISHHGRIFNELPVHNYYHCHTAAFSCFKSVAKDIFTHIIGTGVSVFHTNTLQISLEAFEAPNMADIWFSKFCQENNIPRLILKHPAGWIKQSTKVDKYKSIFHSSHDNCTRQTEVINSVAWSIPRIVL